MTKRFPIFFFLFFWLAVSLAAQTTGVLEGVVQDIQQAVIPGADVVAIEVTTNARLRTLSNDLGKFRFPRIAAGDYRLEVEVPGFKKAVVTDIRVLVGITKTVQVMLEVGTISDSVVVQASQGLIERASVEVTSIIEGQQITELPFTSRDTLDLALTQAGTATPGRPRSSTVNGLPKGALNISIDGIRVQSNYLRSSDGFFTYIRPRVDAIEQFSMTQAGQSAESGGEGAVQIKFVTKKGTNEYHGGAWWYHRNPVLNANYYFNNLAGTERQRQLLNQVGVKIGGPILKDKAFFFFTIDSFHLPQALSRTRTAFTADAVNGIFTYDGTDGQLHTVDVLALAAANGFESTFDPVNKALLDQIAGSLSQPGVGFEPALNPYTQRIRFNNAAKGERYFPTLRLDYHFNENWRWEGVWNYNYFDSSPDTLNGRDPRWPGFQQSGSQLSNRFSLTTALNTTIGTNKNNEFRVGVVGGTVLFSPELGVRSSFYPTLQVGGETISYRPDFSIIDDPLHTESDSRRNSPQLQFADNFSWNRGNHNFTIGGQFSDYKLWLSSPGGALPDISFDVVSDDPADAFFSSSNFPASNTSIRGTAKDLYAMLTGRMTTFASNIYTGDGAEFKLLEPDVDRIKQQEFGLYLQDSWRVRPTLTLNLGLRWQYESNYKENNPQIKYSEAIGGFAGLFGESGAANLFQPGHLPGEPTTFIRGSGAGLYDPDRNNLAPNIGLAWNPDLGDSWASKIFGRNPVFRAGYSISYVQEGTNAGLNVIATGPGYTGQARLRQNIEFTPGSLLTRDALPSPSLNPSRAFDFPIVANSDFRGFSYDEFDPSLASGYVQSWSVGLQRELNPSTVLELRYVGNKGTKLWQQINLEETNIFENGFLDEFMLAQANLNISQELGMGNNFSNQGLPGQMPLPIMEAILTSSNFRSSSWWPLVRDGRVGDMARSMATNSSRFNRMLAAGLPINFFLPNPVCSSCGFMSNSGWSTYNALQVELRRRMTTGLLFQVNYTWSHALTNMNVVASNVFSQPPTMRDFNYGFGPSPFNLYHALKGNWIWELPFGSGRRWAFDNGFMNQLTGGWSIAGIMRMQTGRGFSFDQGGRGTFNENDAGVNYLVPREELQDSFVIRKTPSGEVFWFPSGLIGSDGRSNPSQIAQHTTPGVFGDFFFFEGPSFFRWDLTFSKKTFVTENLNVEFRAELLNAFNNINFLFGGSASGAGNQSPSILSSSFGRITNAYQDTSTTNDLGGRMIQLVLRINF